MWIPKRIARLLANGGLTNPEAGVQSGDVAVLGAEATDVTDERAMQLSAVWSCVRLLSESVGNLPLEFYRQEADGRVPLPDDHPVVELFEKPNQAMTGLELREALTCQLVLWGNAYAKIGFAGRGSTLRPVSLTPLDPSKMDVVKLADGSIQYHYYTESGTNVYSSKEILHLKGFSAEGLVGFSVLGVARHSMGLSVAAEQYSAGAFRNGGRPVGTLNFSEFLTQEQRTKAREMYQNITSGAVNNTNMWVLEGGVTYQPIQIPPDDLQMLESRQFQLAEIARFFRVPSHLINDSEKATSWGSGLEQLNLAFLQFTLTPYLRRWEANIVRSLLNPADQRSVVVEHNVDGLLRADSKGRADFYSSAAQNGWMTRNEIRAKENLSSVEGGDELTVQVNLTTLEKLGEEPEPVVDPEQDEEFDFDEEVEKRVSEIRGRYPRAVT